VGHKLGAWLGLGAALAIRGATAAQAEPLCTFLLPVGGSGDPVVAKRVGPGRKFGPFPTIPGRRTRLMNFHIGSSTQQGALGFSYRISGQGCN
jgi:hypothetical protein